LDWIGLRFLAVERRLQPADTRTLKRALYMPRTLCGVAVERPLQRARVRGG
jgi:hypothetical protein